jgi:hypothetical protein
LYADGRPVQISSGPTIFEPEVKIHSTLRFLGFARQPAVGKICAYLVFSHHVVIAPPIRVPSRRIRRDGASFAPSHRRYPSGRGVSFLHRSQRPRDRSACSGAGAHLRMTLRPLALETLCGHLLISMTGGLYDIEPAEA